MKIKLDLATAKDVADLVALRNAVSEHLVSTYGEGYWAGKATEKGTLFGMRRSSVYVARSGGRLIATLALSTRKPWAIDTKYFGKSERPLYLTGMAVAPDLQRKGLGKLCLEEAIRVARSLPSDAIRLDAYDAPAGASEFYRKCGFREVGRASTGRLR